MIIGDVKFLVAVDGFQVGAKAPGVVVDDFIERLESQGLVDVTNRREGGSAPAEPEVDALPPRSAVKAVWSDWLEAHDVEVPPGTTKAEMITFATELAGG